MKNSFQISSSVQRALLGEITNNIKGIISYIDNNSLYLKVYFYRKPSEEEKENMRVVMTEVSVDFPHEVEEFKEEFIVWDGKSSFSTIKNLVFLRKD